ncbi:MAG: response regulator [Candidatus Omnitrophota bacterium]
MSTFKLLVVDDEEGIGFFIKKIYEKRGYVVLCATEGIAAVELFTKERPDIVFIDIHMPYSAIDGLEVLKRIKELDAGADCVMITRIDDPETINRSRQLGALHYIPKPFEIEELDACIDEVKAKRAGRS